MVELGILETANVVRLGERQERGLAAGEVEQRGTHPSRVTAAQGSGFPASQRLLACVTQ